MTDSDSEILDMRYGIFTLALGRCSESGDCKSESGYKLKKENGQSVFFFLSFLFVQTFFYQQSAWTLLDCCCHTVCFSQFESVVELNVIGFVLKWEVLLRL